MRARPRIIFLPGLGADHRLLDPQRSIDADIEVPPWIEPDANESLTTYAARFSKSLDTSTPFILGGVSFGGMLAQEIARHTAPTGLILISTCCKGRDLPLIHRAACSTAHVTPAWAIALAKSCMPTLRSLFGIVTSEQSQLFNGMLAATSPRFIRWTLRALLAWPGAGELNIPTIHIHGQRDRIIPIRGLHVDHVIPQAGHVANMTHAAEVNRVIEQWIAKLSRELSPHPPV